MKKLFFPVFFFLFQASLYADTKVLVLSENLAKNFAKRECVVMTGRGKDAVLEKGESESFCYQPQNLESDNVVCVSLFPLPKAFDLDAAQALIVDYGAKGGLVSLQFLESEEIRGKVVAVEDLGKRLAEELATLSRPGDFSDGVRIAESLQKSEEFQRALQEMKRLQIDLLDGEQDILKIEASVDLFHGFSARSAAGNADRSQEQRVSKLREYLAQLVRSQPDRAVPAESAEKEISEAELLRLLEEGTQDTPESLRAQLVYLRKQRQLKENMGGGMGIQRVLPRAESLERSPYIE